MSRDFLNVLITLKNAKFLTAYLLKYNNLSENSLCILKKIQNTETDKLTLSDLCKLQDIRNDILYGSSIPSEGAIIVESKPMKSVHIAEIMEENEKRKIAQRQYILKLKGEK